jgi:hypothetical protein
MIGDSPTNYFLPPTGRPVVHGYEYEVMEQCTPTPERRLIACASFYPTNQPVGHMNGYRLALSSDGGTLRYFDTKYAKFSNTEEKKMTDPKTVALPLTGLKLLVERALIV